MEHRYHIINRTLVYGTLTVILTVIYVSLIFGLQAILRGIVSQENDVAIVLSTLAIAALLQPLRYRLQKIVDRRFYRSKYDAAKIIEAFSSTLRNEVDMDQLSAQLVAVVQETMQPAHVSLSTERSSAVMLSPFVALKVHSTKHRADRDRSFAALRMTGREG